MRTTAILLLLTPWLAAQDARAADADQTIAARVAAFRKAIDPARLEQDVRTLAGFGSRHVLSRTDSATEGTGAARKWLLAQFEALVPQSGGRLSVALHEATVPCTRQGMPREVKVVNVVATLRGTTDPERIYVLGGHYDSRNGKGEDGTGAAPGANDDGSGTALTLEACRVMCATGFPATILFIAFDGEEQGLLGSQAHAGMLEQQGARVDGMIGCDIVGNTLGMDGKRYDGFVRCFSYAPTGNDSIGRSLARAVAHAARTHVPELPVKLIFRGDRYGRGGDHHSYHLSGFPSVRMTEPREDYSRQHQDVTERDGKPYADLPEFVDYPYLARVTGVVVAALAELASAPAPPLARSATGARDRYDTILQFEPPAGVDDFEFVWRETTAPDWQGVIGKADANVVAARRGTGLVATLPGLCIDDVVIGVRSIGRDGSRSRVATPPEPERSQQRRGR